MHLPMLVVVPAQVRVVDKMTGSAGFMSQEDRLVSDQSAA